MKDQRSSQYSVPFSIQRSSGSPTDANHVRLQLLANLVLLQVVVAVLVDKFRQSSTVPPTSSRRLEQRTSLQPLLRELTNAFENTEDLRARLRSIFSSVCATGSSYVDVDDWDGGFGPISAVSFRGLQAGLAGLGYVPPIRFSEVEWHNMVERRKLCDGRKRLSWPGFETMLRENLRAYQVFKPR